MSARRARAAWVATLLGAGALGACAAPGPTGTPVRASDAEREERPVVAAAIVLSEAPWTGAGADGVVIRTPHYRLYTTESDPVLRERAAKFLEYALAHYRSAVTRLPPPLTKLDTYLLDNRAQWERVTKRIAGPSSDLIVRIRRGGFAVRGVGVYYDLGLYDTLAIAAHEGWHQFTQRTFADPLPIWLEEGMAVYMEGHRWRGPRPTFAPWANVERFDRLVAMVNAGRAPDLRRLLDERPQDHIAEDATDDVLDYYAGVWALAHFLAEGRAGGDLGAVLGDASGGRLRGTLADAVGRERARRALAARLGPVVFQAYFEDDLASAQAAFGRFVREITRPGARDAIVRGVSPLRVGEALGSRTYAPD